MRSALNEKSTLFVFREEVNLLAVYSRCGEAWHRANLLWQLYEVL